jgi:hypothetical protein
VIDTVYWSQMNEKHIFLRFLDPHLVQTQNHIKTIIKIQLDHSQSSLKLQTHSSNLPHKIDRNPNKVEHSFTHSFSFSSSLRFSIFSIKERNYFEENHQHQRTSSQNSDSHQIQTISKLFSTVVDVELNIIATADYFVVEFVVFQVIKLSAIEQFGCDFADLDQGCSRHDDVGFLYKRVSIFIFLHPAGSEQERVYLVGSFR